MTSHPQSGIPAAPHLQWGSHLAHVFSTGAELRDLLVPYFQAGLENNERCLWVTGSVFRADEARSALRAAIPNLDDCERSKHIEIADAEEWYASGEKLRPNEIVAGLLQREQTALAEGYEGLRTNGNCAWVSRAQWADFQEYETLVGKAMRGRRMLCMCSYCVDQLLDGSHLEVMGHHDLVLPSQSQIRISRQKVKRPIDDVSAVLEVLPAAIYTTDGGGYLTYYNQAAADLWGYRPELGRQQWCGTWKIFLPDGTPVSHEQCPMATALQTRQPIHGIEADAERPDGTRVPCVVYPTPLFDADGTVVGGVNMLVDISHRKAQEVKSAALAHEMHHRVNNTLSTVMAIMGSTLRVATTMDEFREDFVSRITALSKTHALLTQGVHASVPLRDLLNNELHMFVDNDNSRVRLSGPNLALSERTAVPVGMALHELATNAAKYGALSVIGGRVSVEWSLLDGIAQIAWRETNVPMPKERERVGFGTHLLTNVLPNSSEVSSRLTMRATA
jgi:PAS domain S-box-containing protein